MKAKFRQFSLIMLLVMTIGTFFLNSCGDSNKKEEGGSGGPDNPLADGVALFGYNADDNQFFVQHVTSSMGAEINRGAWTLGNQWKPMTYFTVGGKQYIMGHKKDPNSYFIQEIYTSGDLGKTTDTGTWNFYYEVLISLQMGDRTFIYGESKDNSDYWFVQEILPGGKLGAETDNGEWGVTYDAVVALPLPNKSCFFAHTGDDAQFYKTMCLRSDGTLYEQDEGHWGNHWQTVASYRAGNNTYLFTHRKRYDSGDVTYRGPWSIVRIPDNGDVWGDTDAGEWSHYYKTMTTFYDKGTDMFYLAGMNTDKHFFIQHVTFDGTMGAETDSGNWGHYFDYFFPIALDTKYLYTDNWMGRQISTIGSRKLSEIALPGSHDAGMNDADHGDCYMADRCNTVTQQGDIAYQLSRGSRYFDIRPVLTEFSDGTDNWRTAHQTLKGLELYGCKGEDKLSIVDDLQNFFSSASHKNELVILKISHCAYRVTGAKYDCDRTIHTPAQYHQDGKQLDYMAQNMAWHLDGHGLFKCDGCNPLEMTVNEILEKGNIIIVMSGESISSGDTYVIPVTSNPAAGIFVWGKDFSLYDQYSNSNDFETMRNDQVAKLLTSGNHNVPFLLSWTLTLNSLDAVNCDVSPDYALSILDYSMQAQWRLYHEMVDLVNTGKMTKRLFPNILYTDDFNGTATRAAIYLNEQYGNLK